MSDADENIVARFNDREWEVATDPLARGIGTADTLLEIDPDLVPWQVAQRADRRLGGEAENIEPAVALGGERGDVAHAIGDRKLVEPGADPEFAAGFTVDLELGAAREDFLQVLDESRIELLPVLWGSPI